MPLRSGRSRFDGRNFCGGHGRSSCGVADNQIGCCVGGRNRQVPDRDGRRGDCLPVILCPRSLATVIQPVAVDDVLAYLLAARELPAGMSRTFEIGSTDVVTYADLIREYARQKGLRRWLIFVPVQTPYLSGLWLA